MRESMAIKNRRNKLGDKTIFRKVKRINEKKMGGER